MDGQNYIIDKFLGIYVDDIMICNKGIYGLQNTKEPQGDRPSCFAERLHMLLYFFKFGFVEYYDQQSFCGTHIQAMDRL